MLSRLMLVLLAALAITVSGCQSVKVDAGLYQPADLTATALARNNRATFPTPAPVVRPTGTPRPAPSSPTPVPPTATPAARPAVTVSPSPSPATGTDPAAMADAAAATQVILDYLGSIDRQDYARAYGYWAANGTASGSTLEQFRSGYSDTVRVSAQLGGASVQGKGPGRTATVTVTLTSVVNAAGGDQQVKHYQGSYTLAPSGAAGWQIAGARMAEVAGGPLPPADLADPRGLLGAYFDAISRRDLARAYTYWDNLGQSSTQTFVQFAQGFATTAKVTADLGEPILGGAAGSVYAEVPTVVVAAQSDGTIRAFCGTYTLRRANVPPFDQLGWRIETADVGSTAVVEPGSPEAQRLLTGGCQR